MGTLLVIVFVVICIAIAAGKQGAQSARSDRRASAPTRHVSPPRGTAPRSGSARPTYAASRPADVHFSRQTQPGSRDRIPFAEPGMKGQLFTYGGQGHRSLTRQIDGPFAVVDFQTTGLSPRGRDRIIEVAVVRVENGVVGDPWSTLVNPGRGTGASFIHHIENSDVAKAPAFGDIAPYLLSQLDGAVVVAHNATFDEAFLAAELDRAGLGGMHMPALCSLWLSQWTMSTPNHKLPTLARELGVSMANNVSRDQVLATAAVLQYGLSKQPVLYGCEPFRWTGGRVAPPRVANRVVGLRKGSDGYMSSLLSKLPVVAAETPDAQSEAYLEALTAAMADGQITRDEAVELGSLAGEAGLTKATVAGLNERFLETMREAAFADDVLTVSELRELKRAAKALGVPAYFDDLQPTATPTRFQPGSSGQEGRPSSVGRKCGHCGEPGHYRPRCPVLVAGS